MFLKIAAVTSLSGSSILSRWFIRHACGACDYSHVCHEGVNSPGNIIAIVGVLITNLTPLAPVSIAKN